jgi:hypothetical protein
VPNSVWNLQYGVWRGLAAEADMYVKEPRKTRFFGLFANNREE